MTIEKTNAQVALECATQFYANRLSVSVLDVKGVAERFLEWLNNNAETTKSSVDLEK